MIKRVAVYLTVIMSLVSVVKCTTNPPKTIQPEAAWINNMHRLSVAYLELIPLTGDARAFSNPSNREMIERNINQLVQGASEAVHDPKAPNVDPIIAFTATRFAIETRQALTAFNVGDQQWARFALARSGDYCISCHTRADRGAKDFKLPWQPNLTALNPLQRVEFYLANRQYSSAATEAKKLATEETVARQDPRAWQITLEKVLAMMIRVQKDPAAAMGLSERMVANAAAPNSIRRDALSWTHEIQNWESHPMKANSDKDRFQAAIRLLRGGETSPYFDRPHSSLISNLRASAVFHELLENPKSAVYNESLYYTGLSEMALRPINLAGLEQTYFENCIRQEPHTALAERCYGSLETSMHQTNPFLELDPESQNAVSLHLADLRKLAEVMNDPELRGPFKYRDVVRPEPPGKSDR